MATQQSTNSDQKITAALALGKNTLKDLCDETGLSYNAVQKFCKNNDIELKRSIRKEKADNDQKIIDALVDITEHNLELSYRKLVERTGLDYQRILSFCKDDHIIVDRSKSQRKIVNEQIIIDTLADIVKNNETLNFQNVLKQSGLKYPIIHRFCDDYGIILERTKQSTLGSLRKKTLDILIDNGESLRKMGELAEVSYQRIEKYIHQTGKHDSWKKKNTEQREKTIKQNKRIKDEEIKRKTEETRKVRNLGNALQIVAAYHQSWPLGKTTEHLLSKSIVRPTQDYTFEQLFNFFSAYQEARIEGQKINLIEIGNRFNIADGTVYHIAKKANLETLILKRRTKDEMEPIKQQRALAKERTALVNALDLYNAYRQGWACGKAVEYLQNRKRNSNNLSFDKIFKLLHFFENAVNNGEKIDYEQLSDSVNISLAQSRNIIKKITPDLYNKTINDTNIKRRKEEKEKDEQRIIDALFDMVQSKEKITYLNISEKTDLSYYRSYAFCKQYHIRTTKHVLQPSIENQKRLGRIRRTDKTMSLVDRSYFADIAIKTAGKHIKTGDRKVRAQYPGCPFGFSYRLASKVYERQDEGMSLEKIAEQLERPLKTVQRILNERETHSTIIMNVLKAMYPEKDIRVPYLTP